ncbi:hypothetical protein [Nocardia nepalensis]|uniref:hypothetical protein n=1 Tax=Nocardia nepalensis TaxID=3375448 RepID=UPI003B680D86
MNIGLVIAIVAVVAVVVKRFYGEPMNARDTFGPPVILLAIGIYSVTKVDDIDGIDITWLVIGGVVGLGFGAIRGTTIAIFSRDGHLWQRYTVRTVVVWAVSMVAGFGVSALGTAMGMHHDARPTTLSIGISMVGEMLTLGLRALSTGVPFAPDKDNSGSLLDRFLPQVAPSSAPRLPFPADPSYPRPGTRRYPPAPNHQHSDQACAPDQPAAAAQPDPKAQPDLTAAAFPPASNQPNRYQPPSIDRSPTLRDGLDWLNRARNR